MNEIRLSPAERRHLLDLLHENAASGEYFGNREQYYARTRRLIDKLLTGGDE